MQTPYTTGTPDYNHSRPTWNYYNNYQEQFPETGKDKYKILQVLHRDDHHENNGQTEFLDHTSCDCCDHLFGNYLTSSNNGQMYYNAWVKSPVSVGPTRKMSVITGDRESLTFSQQHQHATMVMNTSTVQNADNLSGTEGLVAALEYATAAIVGIRGTAHNKLGENMTGCGNPMSHSKVDKQVSHSDPFMLKYSSLHCVEHLQPFCLMKEVSPLELPCVPQGTSMKLQVVGCEKMIPFHSKAMQSLCAHEHAQQETAILQVMKDHLVHDETCQEILHPRGTFQQQQGEKVGYHVSCGSELEESDISSKDNSVALNRDRDNSHMPRPFHPAIGRPQNIIPSFQHPTSKGTFLDSEIDLEPEAFNIVELSESASSCDNIKNHFESRPLPLAWLAPCQPLKQERTNDPSDFADLLSPHVITAHVAPATTISDGQDSDSSIHCWMPSRQESFREHDLARTICKHGSKSVPAYGHETVALERRNVAIDPDMDDTEYYKVNQTKTSKAENPTVKPLNAYNYFYSEMREGILELGKAELEMLILNHNKHNENDHNGCPGRNHTLYQPGLLAHTILLKQETRFSKAERKRLLLSKHWNKDRTTRRKHRKKHGKISFNHMNTLVSTEWKSLSDTQKRFYKEVAEADNKRYNEQKEIY